MFIFTTSQLAANVIYVQYIANISTLRSRFITCIINITCLSSFLASYLGLASFRFGSRGGLTPGVGGGNLAGNVERLASDGGATVAGYVDFHSYDYKQLFMQAQLSVLMLDQVLMYKVDVFTCFYLREV